MVLRGLNLGDWDGLGEGDEHPLGFIVEELPRRGFWDQWHILYDTIVKTWYQQIGFDKMKPIKVVSLFYHISWNTYEYSSDKSSSFRK